MLYNTYMNSKCFPDVSVWGKNTQILSCLKYEIHYKHFCTCVVHFAVWVNSKSCDPNKALIVVLYTELTVKMEECCVTQNWFILLVFFIMCGSA